MINQNFNNNLSYSPFLNLPLFSLSNFCGGLAILHTIQLQHHTFTHKSLAFATLSHTDSSTVGPWFQGNSSETWQWTKLSHNIASSTMLWLVTFFSFFIISKIDLLKNEKTSCPWWRTHTSSKNYKAKA